MPQVPVKKNQYCEFLLKFLKICEPVWVWQIFKFNPEATKGQ